MRTRRFDGWTLLEAVRRAKAALGPDALIIDAQRLSRRRGWLRRSREAGFAVTAVASGAAVDAPAELQRLGVRVESFAAACEENGRLAEELAALRRAVDELVRRLPAQPPHVSRTRVARVRLAPATQASPTEHPPASRPRTGAGANGRYGS
jgi:hypothetical protein